MFIKILQSQKTIFVRVFFKKVFGELLGINEWFDEKIIRYMNDVCLIDIVLITVRFNLIITACRS